MINKSKTVAPERPVFAVESDVVKELQEKLRFANETVSNLMDQNSKLKDENSLELGMNLS